jgi:hypothetical protein
MSVGARRRHCPAYVLDADGDFVWWYRIDADVTNARRL